MDEKLKKGRNSGEGIVLLNEECLEKEMEEKAEPWLEKRVIKGMFSKLYYELYPLSEAEGTNGGTVVISYGFTESCRKYHEFIYYLLKAGFQCAVMDHRGHGKSLREGTDPDVVYIERFDRYAQDLHEFVHSVVMPRLTGGRNDGLFLYGHSMGGCIGARYLELYPEDFSRAVLNAPMLGLKIGACPAWAAAFVCDILILAGRGSHRLFSHKPFDPEEPFEESCAASRARHEYYQNIRRKEKAYQTSSASYRWAREAIRAGHLACQRHETGKITIPVLLFQAGEDSLVAESAQRKFIAGVRDGRLVKVDNSKHEIYRSSNPVLESYLKQLTDFLLLYTAGKSSVTCPD